jgi:hypothetical protein
MSLFRSSTSVDIGFECPRCAGTEYATWAFPHPLILHWVLNPGLVFNELLLGQRIPKVTYFCRACGGATTDVRYFRCPGCGQFHEEAIWMGSNGFGHWFGMICPDCGCEIPCVLNFTSWIILARLSPINWVLRRFIGRRYTVWERLRARSIRRQLQADRESFEQSVAA